MNTSLFRSLMLGALGVMTAIICGASTGVAAELNVFGSTIINGLASRAPLNLCDSGVGVNVNAFQNYSLPVHFVARDSTNNPNYHVWVCKVGGQDVVMRTQGGRSGDALNALIGNTAVTNFLNHVCSTPQANCETVPKASGGLGCQAHTPTNPPPPQSYLEFVECDRTNSFAQVPQIAVSGVRGASFGQSGPNTIIPPSQTTVPPIDDSALVRQTAVILPLSIWVNNRVVRVNEAGTLVQGPVQNLSRVEVEAIFSKQVTDWRQLGLGTAPPCTAAGIPYGACTGPSPAPAGTAVDATSPILVCVRYAGADSKAAFQRINMINATEPVLNPSPGVSWQSSVKNEIDCIQGANVPAGSNTVGYQHSESLPVITLAYPVRIEGYLGHDTSLSAVPGTFNDDRAKRPVVCGLYPFWVDAGVYKKSGSTGDPTLDTVRDGFIAQITSAATFNDMKNSDEPTGRNNQGYIWAYPTEMFVSKNADRGPVLWTNPGGANASCNLVGGM